MSGSVAHAGKPVEKGKISFEDSANGRSFAVELDASGSYAITAEEGTYRVTVEPLKVEKSAGPYTPPDLVYMDAKDIPKKYRSSATSPLDAKVTKDGEKIDFDLKP